VHLTYTDTDMTSALDIEQNDAAGAATTVVDALTKDATEVLVDHDSGRATELLPGPRWTRVHRRASFSPPHAQSAVDQGPQVYALA
jgi:hypothetical protein